MSLSLSKCTRLIDFRKDKSCMVTITTYVSLNTAQHGDHQSNCGLKFALVEQFQFQVGCAQNYHLTEAPNGLMRIRACIHAGNQSKVQPGRSASKPSVYFKVVHVVLT